MHLYQWRVIARNTHETPTNIGSTKKQCIFTNRESLQETHTKPLQTLGAPRNNASLPIESPCKKQTLKTLQTLGAPIYNASIPLESHCKKQTQKPHKHWEHP